MKGRMIAYNVRKNNTQLELNRFCRQFFGYLDKSQYGRYKYRRKGLLSEIPHISPVRSLVIVRKQDAEKVISFLEGYKAVVFARDVVLEVEDIKKLGGDGDQEGS